MLWKAKGLICLTRVGAEISLWLFIKGETINKPLVIISHGYGAKNTEYSFIANSLAANGYFVATIQHDLETDKPLPTTGNLFDRRKPFWERGVQNILFVIGELHKDKATVRLEQSDFNRSFKRRRYVDDVCHATSRNGFEGYFTR